MKIRTLLLGIVALLCMASCSEDKWTASRLNGAWSGDFGMYYVVTMKDVDGVDREIPFRSSSSYIYFEQYGFSEDGSGYQVDFYPTGPYKHISYKFYWEVRNGDIILTYPRNKEWNTVIKDYKIDYGHFRGYFGTSNERFDLAAVPNYDKNYCRYDVDCYYERYVDYGYYPDYRPYCRSVDAEADSVPAIRLGFRQ